MRRFEHIPERIDTTRTELDKVPVRRVERIWISWARRYHSELNWISVPMRRVEHIWAFPSA